MIDLSFANNAALDMISCMRVGDTLFADHFPLLISFKHSASSNNDQAQFTTPRWNIHANEDRWKRQLPDLIDEELDADTHLASLIKLLSHNASNQPISRDIAQRKIQSAWSCLIRALERAMLEGIGISRGRSR